MGKQVEIISSRTPETGSSSYRSCRADLETGCHRTSLQLRNMARLLAVRAGLGLLLMAEVVSAVIVTSPSEMWTVVGNR